MQRIHKTVQQIERDIAELRRINETLEEVVKLECHSKKSTEDTFYCGICSYSPISTYPHNH